MKTEAIEWCIWNTEIGDDRMDAIKSKEARTELAALTKERDEAREALAIRKAYMKCPICEKYIGDGFDHEATCKYHKAERDLPNSRQLTRTSQPRTAGEQPVAQEKPLEGWSCTQCGVKNRPIVDKQCWACGAVRPAEPADSGKESKP